MSKVISLRYTPVFFTIILYILLYILRWQQGGWDFQTDFFSKQREILDRKISTFLPSPQAELLSGMLLGEKKQLSGQFRLALRDTSTIHIVVVSGQNLTLLAGMIISLSGFLTRRAAIILAFVAVCGYLLISGVQIPALRAAIMVGLTYLAQISGRQADSFWILTMVAALLLLINPTWISDLSFQLSFLATIGVVIVAPILAKRLSVLPVVLRESLAVTMGAQLMVTPITSQNFHQISLVSLPANLLVLWTVPYIMFLGSLMVTLGSMFQPLGYIFSILVGSLLTYFIYIVSFFSSLPFAWEYIGEQVWIVWVGYYLILFAVMLSLNNGKKENSSGSSESSKRFRLSNN